MQNITLVKCIDCTLKYNIKKCSICSTCRQAGKTRFLCPEHYKKAVDRGSNYFLADGDCMCFTCWASWVEGSVDSDEEF